MTSRQSYHAHGLPQHSSLVYAKQTQDECEYQTKNSTKHTFNNSTLHSTALLLLKSPLLNRCPKFRCTNISALPTSKESVSTTELSLHPTQRIWGSSLRVDFGEEGMRSLGTGRVVYGVRRMAGVLKGISTTGLRRNV